MIIGDRGERGQPRAGDAVVGRGRSKCGRALGLRRRAAASLNEPTAAPDPRVSEKNEATMMRIRQALRRMMSESFVRTGGVCTGRRIGPISRAGVRSKTTLISTKRTQGCHSGSRSGDATDCLLSFVPCPWWLRPKRDQRDGGSGLLSFCSLRARARRHATKDQGRKSKPRL